MAILKDQAIVLNLHEQGNTSLVAVMLGRKLGQFRTHIKGARRWPKKGFEGGFDLLVRGEILVYPRKGETLWVFKEWDERARPELGGSLATLRAASFLCELTEALTRPTAGSVGEDTDATDTARAALFDLLAATSDALAAEGEPGPLLLTFTLRALSIEGLMPDLELCSACRRNLSKSGAAQKKIWMTGHGLRCADCMAKRAEQVIALGTVDRLERGVWLSPEGYRALVHFTRSTKALKVSAEAAKQLAVALTALVHSALEYDLRTLQNAARMVYAMGQAGQKIKERGA
ncbi:MAG TPA: DNA repair protein RecO C-terminal domain-containing protein [Planctomycetota bacterium]|nr:DNA repair protein RecO C-terminal domain-containing protein [Planctomycetota bacterium]